MFSRQSALCNTSVANWACAVRPHWWYLHLLTEQHFMGEVSLGFPMSICLLGLGPWHRFPWQEVGVVSLEHSTRSSLVVFGKAEQHSAVLRELWKAPSFCTSPGQHFKLCLEHACAAQGRDPLPRPVRNAEAVTGHNSLILPWQIFSALLALP